MTAFIENPRRTPRILLGCGARIASRSGRYFTTSTVDLGPGGCGVLAAEPALVPGERVFLEIEHEGMKYRLAGRVAWSSTTPPLRSGVAFDGGSLGIAAALFSRIATEAGGRGTESRVARIPESAILARTPAPGSLKAVDREEAEILLAVGDGLEARALPDRLGTSWDGTINRLFALLERGAIEARPVHEDS